MDDDLELTAKQDSQKLPSISVKDNVVEWLSGKKILFLCERD